MAIDFRRGALNDCKAEASAALDRLLGVQSCTKAEKIAGLREIQAAAKRMADGIERRIREDAKVHWLDEVGENWQKNSSHI